MATVKLNTSTPVTLTASYLLTDHLGSVVSKIDDTGTKSDQSFDGVGRHRDPTTWQFTSGGSATLTKHGFTDQEHLDNLNLIHMNGRVYDPMIGRFMSVDPVFQAPNNSQSVNPYSYVMNNPLSLVDPSGYDSCGAADTTTDPSTGGTTTTTTCNTTSTDIGSHIGHHGETTETVTKDSGGRVTGIGDKGNGFGLGQTAEVSMDKGNGVTPGTTGTTMPSGLNAGGSANQESETQKANTTGDRHLTGPCEDPSDCGGSGSTKDTKNGIKLVSVDLNGLATNMKHGKPYLNEATYEKIKNLIAGVKAEYGFDLSFTNAFRTNADIEALEELGDHPAKDSPHLAGLAVDLDWNQIPKDIRAGVVSIARSSGLGWGGNFHDQPIDERHHFYDLSTYGVTRTEAIQSAQQQYLSLTGGNP